MIRRLIAPLTVAIVMLHAGQGFAQGAFPAPLPGQTANSSPFPPVNGAAPSVGAAPSAGAFPPPGGASPFTSAPLAAPPTQSGAIDDCMKQFLPLRDEAEKRGKLIKAASEHHAPPDEACKLIGNFAQAEIKMMKYIEGNAARCQIPPQIGEQLKRGHEATSKMQQKVCQAAEQMKNQKPAGPTLSDLLGSASAVPETAAAKKKGGIFDTLEGNPLAK